jgi:hypothetical protein
VNTNQKKVRVAILVLENVDIRAKNVTGSKEEHFTILKGSIHQVDTIMLNIYAPIIRADK